MMTSPTMGWSLSAPVHLVHIFGLPYSSFGSARPVILPKSLPPCSYISTWDLTLPLFSSTVFHVPVSASLARSVPTLFFFQAEDGIRDLTVTGVRTCALPI